MTHEIFKEKILSVVAAARVKHKRWDINFIYEHFRKVETSNANKNSVKALIPQMINRGILVNKKSPKGYDSFYRKLSNNTGNSNHSQQHLDLDTSHLNS